MEEVEEEDTGLEEGGEYEEKDRLFACHIFPPNEEIHATSTFFQCLAEAHLWNTAPRSFRDSIPDYLHKYEDVFAKESFDTLPEWRQWDHAIKLVPDPKLSNCKVYPMSIMEQAELDHFIREHLQTGHICLSKSLMASLCFFIKKKDSSLQLVQDYQTLNSITIKNRYPLPLISELVNKL